MITVPNLLTLLRLIAVPIFIVASFRGHYTLAFVLFVGAAVTDMLDGMIARRFNQRSRLGALFDPAADKTMMVSGYLYYTLRDGLPVVTIPTWLTFTVFIRDFLILSFAYMLYTRVKVTRFPPSPAGKISTVVQAVTLGTAIGVNAFVPQLLWLAELLFKITAAITLVSGWDYMRRAGRMLDQAPAPK
jgi:cardiolipin synthase